MCSIGAIWSFYKHIFDILITKAKETLKSGWDFNLRLKPNWYAPGIKETQNKSR